MFSNEFSPRFQLIPVRVLLIQSIRVTLINLSGNYVTTNTAFNLGPPLITLKWNGVQVVFSLAMRKEAEHPSLTHA